MEKHLSQNKLEKLYRSELKRLGKSAVAEIKASQKPTDALNPKKSIFLCHSHHDKTIVNKMLLLFNSLEIDLYIDWMDTAMPQLTDKRTATVIKEKIEHSHKFLFLATYNALRSKWCNWELGLAYSSKGENDFAILPIDSKSGNWFGNEYLQLYPEMQIDHTDNISAISASDIKISFYEDRFISFNEWLTKK